MNKIATQTDGVNLNESLRRCSQATIDAAVRFRDKADFSAVPIIVFGILERYQPATGAVKLSEAGENARLIEDIGLDSLTLFEIVMALEEVLKIRIENDELRELRTLGQLNQFLRAKITNAEPACAACI